MGLASELFCSGPGSRALQLLIMQAPDTCMHGRELLLSDAALPTTVDHVPGCMTFKPAVTHLAATPNILQGPAQQFRLYHDM